MKFELHGVNSSDELHTWKEMKESCTHNTGKNCLTMRYRIINLQKEEINEDQGDTRDRKRSVQALNA